MPAIKPILKYPGAKWQLAEWIVGHLPPHIHYVEPFFGSGAVFFNKPAAPHEVINDLSGDVVNLFRVVRERGDDLAAAIALTPWARAEYEQSYHPTDDPMERARRFIVRCQQGHKNAGIAGTYAASGWRSTGKRHPHLAGQGRDFPRDWAKLPEIIRQTITRLRTAEIEQQDALKLIARHDGADVLIYADPPYPLATRTIDAYYEHEMTDADHVELLDALARHSGPVILSGYHCPLYDDRLTDWTVVERTTGSERQAKRTEVLWLNAAAEPAQRGLFDAA